MSGWEGTTEMDIRQVRRGEFKFTVDDQRIEEKFDFWTVFENQSWEPELDEAILEHLGPEVGLVDIGAWVGPVTLMAAGMCRHVWAVEPDPVAANLLRRNVMLSHMNHMVTIRELAISDSCLPVPMGPVLGGRLGDSMTSIWSAEKSVMAPAVTMEMLFDGNIEHVGLIKIDVEGAEERFLPQAKEFLHGLGVPILLSLHTLLAPDKTRYLRVVDDFLDGFDVSLRAGTMDVLGVLLASPQRR